MRWRVKIHRCLVEQSRRLRTLASWVLPVGLILSGLSGEAAAVTFERELDSRPCVQTAGNRYGFVVTIRARNSDGERVDSIRITERIPPGWRVDAASLVVSGGQVSQVGSDSAIVWLLGRQRAACFTSQAGGSGLPTPTPSADVNQCAGIPTGSITYRVFAGTAGSATFDGDVTYRGEDASGTAIERDREVLGEPVSCVSVVSVTRRIEGTCRQGESVGVVLSLDVKEPLLSQVTGLTLRELPPPLWESSAFVPELSRPVSPIGVLTWDRVRSAIIDRDFRYSVRVPTTAARVAEFGGPPEAFALSGLEVRIGDGIVEIPLSGQLTVECDAPTFTPARTPTPTPSPDPLSCEKHGVLGVGCDRSLDTCVSGRCRCVGDCDGDSRVSAGEIQILQSLLGQQPAQIGRCLAGDANGDLRVRSNELTKAVRNTQRSCPGP